WLTPSMTMNCAMCSVMPEESSPMMTGTLSTLTSLRAALRADVALPAESSTMTSNFFPSTPPFSLTSSTARSTARRTSSPTVALAPVSDRTAPIWMVSCADAIGAMRRMADRPIAADRQPDLSLIHAPCIFLRKTGATTSQMPCQQAVVDLLERGWMNAAYVLTQSVYCFFKSPLHGVNPSSGVNPTQPRFRGLTLGRELNALTAGFAPAPDWLQPFPCLP